MKWNAATQRILYYGVSNQFFVPYMLFEAVGELVFSFLVFFLSLLEIYINEFVYISSENELFSNL